MLFLNIHLGRSGRAIVDQRFQIPDGSVKGSRWNFLSLEITWGSITCGWGEAENQAASLASGPQKGEAQRHKKCCQGKISRLEIVHVHTSLLSSLQSMRSKASKKVAQPCSPTEVVWLLFPVLEFL